MTENLIDLEPLTDEEWLQEGNEVRAHYSSLTLHRKCPQAWYYKYDLGLGRNVVEVAAPERDFGSWFGALSAAEALERGRKLDSLKGPMKKFRSVDGIEKFDMATVTMDEVFEAAADWWEKQSPEAVEEWHSRMGEGLPERLQGAYVRWRDEWDKDRKYERPIAVELFWQRQLPRPTGDAAWDSETGGLMLNLLGFIDELYEDTQRGLIVVRDKKTSKNLAQQNAVDDMMDSQLALYGWGAAPMITGWGLPAPRALAYDRVKSSRPTQPKLTLAGRLSASATQFDLQTYREFAAQDTVPRDQPDNWGELTDLQQQYITGAQANGGLLYGTWAEFLKTGKNAGDPKFGIYQEDPAVIERISTPAHRSIFHQRTLVPLSPHIVRAHLRAAVDTATDIYRTQQRAAITGEAARDFTGANCRWCDFAPLCRAQMIGGPKGEYEVAEFGLTQKDGLKIIGVN